MYKKIIYTLYVVLLFSFSCKSSKCEQSKTFKTRIDVEDSCSFDDRKTVEIINGLEGVIKEKSPSYIIEAKNGVKYYACNLPESIKKDGFKVYFCGEKKKEKPTEKVIANLLKLTSLYVE